jgi:hypothetical protein
MRERAGMWSFVKKFNLEIFSIVMLTFVAITAFGWETMSYTKKAIAILMVMFTLHEWEEMRYPGGFFEMLFKRLKIDIETFDQHLAHLFVAILLLCFLLIPYFFDSYMFLLMVPILFAIFEIIFHTAGIFINRLKKPYTPGLITGIIMAGISAYILYTILSNGQATVVDVVIGFVIMVAGYMTMNRCAMKFSVPPKIK